MNNTEIGCTWLIVSIPLVSVLRTMFPASTERMPTRPEIGADNARIVDLRLRIVDGGLIRLHQRLQLIRRILLRIVCLLIDRRCS